MLSVPCEEQGLQDYQIRRIRTGAQDPVQVFLWLEHMEHPHITRQRCWNPKDEIKYQHLWHEVQQQYQIKKKKKAHLTMCVQQGSSILLERFYYNVLTQQRQKCCSYWGFCGMTAAALHSNSFWSSDINHRQCLVYLQLVRFHLLLRFFSNLQSHRTCWFQNLNCLKQPHRKFFNNCFVFSRLCGEQSERRTLRGQKDTHSTFKTCKL